MNYLYIGIAVGVVLIAIISFFITKSIKIKKLKTKTSELERQRNLIVSTPIMSELAKIDVIIRNDKLESKYEDWKKRYEEIKTKRFAEVTDMLLNIDSLIDDKKYKDAKQALVDLDMEIYKLRVSTDNLLDEIREVTMSEERNRAIVIKLKSKYRELERTLDSKKEAYGDIYKFAILQLENIEKKFQEFEVAMEDNNYEEVVGLVKVLDEMISHMSTVVEEVPDLILLTEKIIPTRIKEIKETYNSMIAKGYPLDFLQIDHNIDEIEKKLSTIKDKVKMLNLEDCMFELKTFLDYLDNALNDFDIEKKSKKEFDESANEFKNKLTKINKIVTDIYSQLEDIKNMYNLTETDLNDLDTVNRKIFDINKEYNDIIGDLRNKIRPYSELKEAISKLQINFDNTEEELNICLKSLGSMHDDELRAREQLDEVTDLLKKCRLKIRSYPLPIISNNYFVELSEANESIYEIVKELQKTPITIKTLNIRVDNARDLSLKLYNTTNEMVKTAKMCEMTIVYGNRYKPLDKDIEKGLDEASKLFFKGNYKKSLEVSIATINIIEPGIYDKILNLYKNIEK